MIIDYHQEITYPANTRRWTNAGLMLAHRLRRWPNISPALIQSFVSTGTVCLLGYIQIKREALPRCWVNVGPSSSTLAQLYHNIGPTSRACYVWQNSKAWINVGPMFLGVGMAVCKSFASAPSQQTRDIDPMLFQCWASVCDDGPAMT